MILTVQVIEEKSVAMSTKVGSWRVVAILSSQLRKKGVGSGAR